MKIAVAGTGYVGLVAGVCFAHVGHDVTCVDVDENKVQMMRQGISPIYEQDIEDVAKGMSYDCRIGDRFLNAGIGYGGSCFPKDTKALRYIAKENGYTLRTVEAAVDVNNDQKIRLFKKAAKRMITFAGLKVAVLGLTFKPGTDDLREAPSVDNVELLLKNGAIVYAYDPVGENNYKMKFPEKDDRYPGKIMYTKDVYEAINGSEICFIFTEWDEIKKVKPEEYKKLMSIPLIYDGRNIYNPKDMKSAGIEYYSIGRSIYNI